MPRASSLLVIGGLALSAAAAGCELLVGFDYGLIGQGGSGGAPAGGGGAGGEGNATTTTTTTTTPTEMGGGGGAGGCTPEDDNLDCTTDVCNPDGTTAHDPVAAGTPCNDGGGTECDALGNCQSTCTDGVQNGAETDVDCGGACPPCVVLDPNGTSCTTGPQCQSLNCVDGVCCDTTCTGMCMACTSAKTGGANGTCANVTGGTDPDDECGGVNVCVMGTCQKLPKGSPCMGNGECQSNFCVNGVCCSSDCNGQCRRCDAPGSVGDCALIPINQDPMDLYCPGLDKACNGGGQCLKVTGQACMSGGECISGTCMAMVCL